MDHMGVRFWPLFDQREVFGSIRFFINVNPVNWLNENLALLENLEFWIPKFGRQKTVPEPAVCSNCVLDTNVDLVEFSTHIRIKENLWPPNSRPSASSRLGLHSPIEFTDRLNSASVGCQTDTQKNSRPALQSGFVSVKDFRMNKRICKRYKTFFV